MANGYSNIYHKVELNAALVTYDNDKAVLVLRYAMIFTFKTTFEKNLEGRSQNRKLRVRPTLPIYILKTDKTIQ